MQDYINRLIVPITANQISLYNSSKNVMCMGYDRIVIGERGPYVECSINQIMLHNFHIPDDQKWRLSSLDSYYTEYRSNDNSNLKLYYQSKLVNYADYKIGLFYMSPFELYTETGNVLITKLRRKSK